MLAPTLFQLTDDQQNALDRFIQFLGDPSESVFVLQGYAGCGKTTMVRTLLERLPGIQSTLGLVDPKYQPYPVHLTATTNKAAEAMRDLTGEPCTTIHGFLGLRVSNDPVTRESRLVHKTAHTVDPCILVIDEASFIDTQLLRAIFTTVRDSKIVFIGDPAQLAPFKSQGAAIFGGTFPGASLTRVVRQDAGNLLDLVTALRQTVITGQWPTIRPDNTAIFHLPREDFMAIVDQEFTQPGWQYHDSKILAWTNQRVISFNHRISLLTKGQTAFQAGDYAICNSFVSGGRRQSIKTDQTVQITAIEPDSTSYGVPGNWVELDHSSVWFMPHSQEEKKKAIREAHQQGCFSEVSEMENSWIDLRAAYAQTVNKSQGSTYDKVFIDLDDIGRCNSADQLARMLYVAVSRARTHVYFTGDLA